MERLPMCRSGGEEFCEGAVAWYERHAEEAAARYEAMSAGELHGWLRTFLRDARGTAVDIGAGSGRDAAWLCSLGWAVVAVEPSAGMRRAALALHQDAAVRWVDDRLPSLAEVRRLGVSAGLVLLSAVWQHVHPGARAEAMRSVASLLAPGGTLALTLRQGPADAARCMYPVSAGEAASLAAEAGLAAVRSVSAADILRRRDVAWTHMAFRRPGR